MRLKAIFLILFSGGFCGSLNAGCSYLYCVMMKDTILVDGGCFEPGTPMLAAPGWIGKVYVAKVEQGGNMITAQVNVTVYFQPGDTIDNGDYESGITVPGQYSSNLECQGDVYATITYSCYYFTDSMEAIYLSRFDKEYDDSLSAIASYIAHPPTNNIYPNPVINNLYFEDLFYEPAAVEFTIFDMEGKNVLSQNYDMPAGVQSRTIDLSRLESGVYLLRYNTGTSQVVKRIVKI